MKRKILSAVAISAIAAGLIGCGGSSSSSSTTTTSTQPTKVKGVDGYVMNAKISVKYWDKDTNKTKTAKVDASDSYFLTVDSTTNKKRPGKPIYSLADLNKTVLDNVVSVIMTSQAQGKLANGSVYSQTFFDADGNGELNTSVDVTVKPGISLKAPKGYSVVTPVSTIIANQVEAKLLADKNESNLTNVIDAYTKDVANALGVDETTIKNVDPLSLVNSKDEKAQAYVVANAFAGALIKDNANLTNAFNALKKAKAPKTAADVIANLATAAKAAGDTSVANLLTEVESLIKTDKANLEALVKSNLDKTRYLSEKDGDVTLVSLNNEAKDFNITDISTIVGSNGYKIPRNELNNLYITLAPNDQNISNKKFTFVIRIADPKGFNRQDANVSELTVKVPFEVNSTNGNIAAAIPADEKVVFEGMNQNGTKIISGETNSTIFGTNDSIISVSNNKITFKAKTLLDDVDANQSGAFFGGSGLPNKIYEVQAGIVTDSAEVVEDGNYVLLPQDSITSIGGTINETVNSMISFNIPKDLVADMRQDVNSPRDNEAPNNDLNVSIWQPNETLANTTPSVGSDTNDSSGRVIVNNNQALDINLSGSTVDSWEKNTTVSFTLGNYLTDKNLTGVNTKLVNNITPAVVNNAIDVNTTSTDDGNLTTYITYKVCDEFDECNTTTAYLVVNRKPIYNLDDHNSTTLVVFEGLDGFGDINVTNNYVTLLENNGTEVNVSNTAAFTDVNVTNNLVVGVRLAKLNNGVGGKNLALEFNRSISSINNIKYFTSSMGANDWNLSIYEYNVTDGYFNNNYKTDVNLTIK